MNEEKIPEFGEKKENEERRDGGIGIVFDPKNQKYAVAKHHDGGLIRLFSGGVDADEDIQTGVLREVSEESGLFDFGYVEKIGAVFAHYYNSLRKVNRVTYSQCFLIILKSSERKEVQLEEHEKFDFVWVSVEEMMENWSSRNKDKGLDHWIYFLKRAVARAIELGYDKTNKKIEYKLE